MKMVLIFTQTTTCLASEFVDYFSAEKLALSLARVKKETGVECTRRYRTVNIIGEWKSIVAAFKSFENILQEQSPFAEIQESAYCNDLNSTEKASVSLKKQKHLPPPFICDEFPNPNQEISLQPNETLQVEVTHTKSIKDRTVNEPKTKLRANETLQNNDDEIVNERENNHEPIKTLPMQKLHLKSLELQTDHGLETRSIALSATYKDKECNVEEDNDVYVELVKQENDEDNFEDANKDNQIMPDDVSNHVDQLDNVKTLKIKEADNLFETVKRKGIGKLCNGQKKSKKPKVQDSKCGELACDLCPYVGKKIINLNNHIIRKHGKNYCEVCDKTFDFKIDLKRHTKEHEQKKKSNHSQNKVKGDKENSNEYRCKFCPYTGKKKVYLKKHMNRKHCDKYSCDMCEKQFDFNKDLNRHIKQVHSESMYFCDKCHKLYKSKKLLDKHMKIHNVGYVKPEFVCEVCEKTFSSKYVLSSHIKSEHLGMKKCYSCPTCGQSFTQKSSYLTHANVNAGIKPYNCDVCGKSFAYPKSLREHRYMHDQTRRFQCHLCEKTFRQSSSLHVHMKTHQERRDYICTSCGKGFTQKQALLRHERIHSGVKPFTCTLCSKAFNDHSIIRRHLILIHKKSPQKWNEHVKSTADEKTDFFIKAQSQMEDNREDNKLMENNPTENDRTTKSPCELQVTNVNVTECSIGVQKDSLKVKSSIVEKHLHQPVPQPIEHKVSNWETHTDMNSGSVPINYSSQVSLAANTQQSVVQLPQSERNPSSAQVGLKRITEHADVRQSSGDRYSNITVNDEQRIHQSVVTTQPQVNLGQELRLGYPRDGFQSYYNIDNQPHYSNSQ